MAGSETPHYLSGPLPKTGRDEAYEDTTRKKSSQTTKRMNLAEAFWMGKSHYPQNNSSLPNINGEANLPVHKEHPDVVIPHFLFLLFFLIHAFISHPSLFFFFYERPYKQTYSIKNSFPLDLKQI